MLNKAFMHTSTAGTSCISTLTSNGRTCASYGVTWFVDTMTSLGAFIAKFSWDTRCNTTINIVYFDSYNKQLAIL